MWRVFATGLSGALCGAARETTPKPRKVTAGHLLAPGLAALTLLISCTEPTPYAAPVFSFGKRYQAATQAAPVVLRNDDWWLRLKDPVLNRLVTAALAGNPSLDVARGRVAQAQAQVDGAASLVNLSSSVSADARTRESTAQAGLGWLLDPYGAHRAAKAAARAGVQVAQAELDSARLLLLYNLGNAYADLRYRQTLLALQDEEMQSRRKTLAMTQKMADVQDATRLDIARSEARVADLEAQRPALLAAIQGKENEIAVLTGAAPGALPADLSHALHRTGPQPRPSLSPDVGIPADLLRNRPDIQVAERQYYIAVAGVTQAEAALYPKLSLAGTLTRQGIVGGKSASSYVFGPSIQLPVLPGKAARAGVDEARAAVATAQGNWKSTVLTALLEVENAMLDYQAATAAQTSSDKAARLYGEALDLTRKVFGQGDATLSDLIDAEQALAQARQAQAQTLDARARSFIALNVRLGAGSSAQVAP